MLQFIDSGSLCSTNPLHSLISVHADITFYISQVITAEQDTIFVEYIEEKRYVGKAAKESVKPFSTKVKYSLKKRSARWIKAMKLATRFVIHHHPYATFSRLPQVAAGRFSLLYE